jgi:hypothetical protein
MVPLHRSAAFGKLLAVFGLLLSYVALALTSPAAKGGFTLLLMGLLFFGCGGGTLPVWQRRTAIGWLSLGLGLTLMAMGFAWFIRGPIPWLVRTSDSVMALALALMALGLLWVFMLRAEES